MFDELEDGDLDGEPLLFGELVREGELMDLMREAGTCLGVQCWFVRNAHNRELVECGRVSQMLWGAFHKD